MPDFVLFKPSKMDKNLCFRQSGRLKKEAMAVRFCQPFNVGVIGIVLFLGACAHTPTNSYETSTPEERSHFKKVTLPLPEGTHFKISQGAFGCCTHNDPGHEYTWDFDVPYGTHVLSVEDGTVIQVWEPNQGGGCDRKYNESPHNIKIEHSDGTVAQYTHIHSVVKAGDTVKRGQTIAVTAGNGFICTPQLDFTIFKDRNHLFGSGQQRNIPLLFEGLPDSGMAHEGYEGVVPIKNASCESHLEAITCLVDPPHSEKERYTLNRACKISSEPIRYSKEIEEVYVGLPDFLQRQLCGLSKLYIESEFFGNAWSDTGIIALNKNLLDANPTESQLLSGFDQLTFGGQSPGYKPSLPFPKVSLGVDRKAIKHILLHELAHTFDYQYDFQKKGWRQLSWLDDRSPKPTSDFKLRSQICLNNCKGHFISADQIPVFYHELNQKGFVSQLAAISPMEDFAETFAVLVERDFLNQQVKIDTGKGTIDPMTGESLKRKFSYMDQVIDWLKKDGRRSSDIFQNEGKN